MKEVSLEQRVLNIEGTVKELKNNMDEVLYKAYDEAVKNKDEDVAAEIIRKIRNKKLKESDSEYTLDRLNLDFSSVTSLLRSMKNLVNNEWSIYRKELRDLPDQPGFPFDIKFPEKPEISIKNYFEKAAEEKNMQQTLIEYPEYKSGHRYLNHDKVTFKNKRYICTIPLNQTCIWNPIERPLYWKIVTE